MCIRALSPGGEGRQRAVTQGCHRSVLVEHSFAAASASGRGGRVSTGTDIGSAAGAETYSATAETVRYWPAAVTAPSTLITLAPISGVGPPCCSHAFSMTPLAACRGRNHACGVSACRAARVGVPSGALRKVERSASGTRRARPANGRRLRPQHRSGQHTCLLYIYLRTLSRHMQHTSIPHATMI